MMTKRSNGFGLHRIGKNYSTPVTKRMVSIQFCVSPIPWIFNIFTGGQFRLKNT